VVRTIREHGYSLALPLGMLEREAEAFEREVENETTVEQIDDEEVITVIDDTWYQLVKTDTQFEGVYLRVADFNRLTVDASQVLNLYDLQGKLVNRLSSTKSRDAFSVTVEHNSRNYSYRLLTHKRERRKRIRRRAHEIVVKHWNTRYDALHGDVVKALHALRDGKPAHWDAFEAHLFTDKRMAPFVKANHEEVTLRLEKLELRLQKLRYGYEHGEA